MSEAKGGSRVTFRLVCEPPDDLKAFVRRLRVESLDDFEASVFEGRLRLDFEAWAESREAAVAEALEAVARAGGPPGVASAEGGGR